MNRERAKELLPIIQAFAEGRPIEAKYYTENDDRWSASTEPKWSDVCDYRIKPERRKVWVVMPKWPSWDEHCKPWIAYSEKDARDYVSHCKVVCVEEPD